MAVASSPFDLGHIFDALRELTLEQTKTLIFSITGRPPHAPLIEGENIGKGLVIAHWLEGNADASWEKIRSGLKQMNLNVLAKKIDSQYCTLPQVPPSCTDNFSADSTVCESHQCPESVQQTPLPQSVASSLLAGKVAGKVNSEHTQPLELAAVSGLPTDSTTVKVMEVREAIAKFENDFFEIYFHLRQLLMKMEIQDPEFLDTFHDYLLSHPLSKKGSHISFFRENEDDILAAKNTRKLLAILNRYCTYSNNDIIHEVIKMFGDDALKKQMSEYCPALEEFEKSTTFDAYSLAISVDIYGVPTYDSNWVSSRMHLTIDKPTKEYTLYDCRKFKE